MNNIDELLSRWDEHRTFTDMPFRHIMPECTVTMDDRVGEEKGLDKLINETRRKINNSIKKVRSSINIER